MFCYVHLLNTHFDQAYVSHAIMIHIFLYCMFEYANLIDTDANLRDMAVENKRQQNKTET